MRLTPRQHHDDTVTDHHREHAEHTPGPLGPLTRCADERVLDDTAARDRFGGANWGAAFFGWLVAVGMTALLTGILAAAATAVGYSQGITQSDAEREAGTFSLVTALALLAVLLISYYAGGYVAGRMSALRRRSPGCWCGSSAWWSPRSPPCSAGSPATVQPPRPGDVPQIPIPSNEVTAAGIMVALVCTAGDAAPRSPAPGRPLLHLQGGPRTRGRQRLRTLFVSHAGHRV